MNEKIICVYNSVDGGDSDAKECEEELYISVVTKSEEENLLGFTVKGFWCNHCESSKQGNGPGCGMHVIMNMISLYLSWVIYNHIPKLGHIALP